MLYSMLRQVQVVLGKPILPLLLQSHLPYYQLVCLAELQYQNHCRATAELHQLEFRRDIGARVSPMQAAPDPFKLRVSVVTSVLGHVRVGALPIVLSESRCNGYMTSVRHSESVVVRLSTLIGNRGYFKRPLCWSFCEVRLQTRNRMAGIQLDPFKIIWRLRLFVFNFSAYHDRKTWEFSNFVLIRFARNNF